MEVSSSFYEEEEGHAHPAVLGLGDVSSVHDAWPGHVEEEGHAHPAILGPGYVSYVHDVCGAQETDTHLVWVSC